MLQLKWNSISPPLQVSFLLMFIAPSTPQPCHFFFFFFFFFFFGIGVLGGKITLSCFSFECEGSEKSLCCG